MRGSRSKVREGMMTTDSCRFGSGGVTLESSCAEKVG